MTNRIKVSKENARRLREARRKTGEAAIAELKSRPGGKKLISEYKDLIKKSFEAEGIPFSSAYIKSFLSGVEQTSLLKLPEGMKYGLACILYVEQLEREDTALNDLEGKE